MVSKFLQILTNCIKYDILLCSIMLDPVESNSTPRTWRRASKILGAFTPPDARVIVAKKEVIMTTAEVSTPLTAGELQSMGRRHHVFGRALTEQEIAEARAEIIRRLEEAERFGFSVYDILGSLFGAIWEEGRCGCPTCEEQSAWLADCECYLCFIRMGYG